MDVVEEELRKGFSVVGRTLVEICCVEMRGDSALLITSMLATKGDDWRSCGVCRRSASPAVDRVTEAFRGEPDLAGESGKSAISAVEADSQKAAGFTLQRDTFGLAAA
jgi:hypothetical protein